MSGAWREQPSREPAEGWTHATLATDALPTTVMKPPRTNSTPDAMLSSPADIESAGRSCMAILVLAAIIFLLLCVWIGLRSTGVGQ